MDSLEDFEKIINFITNDVADKSENVKSGNILMKELEYLKSQKNVYSDIVNVDDENQYYINLVQEGGGTLGFALIGFVFALEYCNIRFLRLAGTSAGAINTVLMHYNGTHNKPKSPILFEKIRNKPLMDFVDGHRVIKYIIKNLLKKNGRVEFFAILFLLPFLLLITTLPVLSIFTNSVYLFYLIGLLMVFLFIAFLILFNYRFKKLNFGLNPGNNFHEFIRKNIPIYPMVANQTNIKFRNGTYDAKKFAERIKQSSSLCLNFDDIFNGNHLVFSRLISDYFFDYTVISSEIVSKSKIEFPKDKDLFWDELTPPHPADFVRASMSIPIFFRPFEKRIILSKSIISAWKNKMFVDDKSLIPDVAVFVDGGVLSNFPINIFHDSQLLLARVPVIGARLEDTKPEKPSNKFGNIVDYSSSIFNTVRFNFDKNFLIKHSFYEKYSVARIDVYKTKISWLNFALSDKEKRELMKTGIESAIDFLNKYDWDQYQVERALMILTNKMNTHEI